MKKITVWVLATALLFPLLGCAARQVAPEPPVEVEREVVVKRAVASDVAPAPAAEEAGLPEATDMERMIIYDVTLDLIVQDTEAVFDEIGRLTSEMGGYVAASNVWRDEGHARASLTVRVPAGSLDDALSRFRDLAVDVERERIDSQDVTADYVDLEARLRNERRTEAELLELLESRSETGKTEDILEVHRELGQVRQRIEQIQGQMRVMENLSDMATVRISLTPDALVQPIVVGGWQPRGTARNAIRMLLRTLQFFADASIVFTLYILPVMIVIAIPIAGLYLIVRAIWRAVRRRRRKARQDE